MAERNPSSGVEQDTQDDNNKTTYAFNKKHVYDLAPFTGSLNSVITT